MQEKPIKRPLPGRMNIIAAICLVLVTLFVYLEVFSFGYGVDLFYSWNTLTEALRSGILYINAGDGEAGLAAIGYFLISIWSLVALIKYSFGRPYRDKSLLIWACALFVIACFLTTYFLFLQSSCVDKYPLGSSSVCAAPVRPGIVPPTPVP